MSDIATGDLVKCIDSTPTRPESQIMPDLETLYVVASIRQVADGYSVRLKELSPSCRLGGACACGECGWDATRFRRVYRPDPDLIARLLENLYDYDPTKI